jgi:hypothetical protein
MLITCDNSPGRYQQTLRVITHRLRSMHRRSLYLAFGVLLLVGTWWAAVPRATGAFTPFVRDSLPQRAAADFDADGRPDVAFIQPDRDGFWVSVSLSGSPDTVTLEVNAGSGAQLLVSALAPRPATRRPPRLTAH